MQLFCKTHRFSLEKTKQQQKKSMYQVTVIMPKCGAYVGQHSFS